MATLASLTTKIQSIIQDSSITDITDRINEAVSMIAGGVRLQNGQISPPLPGLYSTGTVATSTSAALKALPTTYQRNVFLVVDDSGDTIQPPSGGDYYSFALFLKAIQEKDLSESGSIYRVCVKGSNLYYQGIPTASENLTVHFYRKPVELADNTDEVDGIPDHLQIRLIKHYVCGDILGEMIEAGEDSRNMGHDYHMGKFYTAMIDLVDFIGIDAEPIYMAGGNDSFTDGAICD